MDEGKIGAHLLRLVLRHAPRDVARRILEVAEQDRPVAGGHESGGGAVGEGRVGPSELRVVAGRPAEVIQMRDAWVAGTRAEADAVYGPHVMTAYRYYWENRLAEFREIPEGTEFSLANLAPDRLVLGDPETCVREFRRWREVTGADYFLLRLRHARGPARLQALRAPAGRPVRVALALREQAVAAELHHRSPGPRRRCPTDLSRSNQQYPRIAISASSS